MKSAIDYVVGMVSMRNSLVAAARAMDMAIFMLNHLTSVWIRFASLQMMLVIVIAMLVVHVAVMQVVDVISMPDFGVTTVLAVDMGMVLVNYTFFVCHGLLPTIHCRSALSLRSILRVGLANWLKLAQADQCLGESLWLLPSSALLVGMRR